MDPHGTQPDTNDNVQPSAPTPRWIKLYVIVSAGMIVFLLNAVVGLQSSLYASNTGFTATIRRAANNNDLSVDVDSSGIFGGFLFNRWVGFAILIALAVFILRRVLQAVRNRNNSDDDSDNSTPDAPHGNPPTAPTPLVVAAPAPAAPAGPPPAVPPTAPNPLGGPVC